MNNIHMLVNSPIITFADIASGKVTLKKPGVSLDVENLSLEKNGVLLEVGLVLFDLADLSSVGRLPMLNLFLDTNDQILSSGHVDPETIKWWRQERIAAAYRWQQNADERLPYKDAASVISAWVNQLTSALELADHKDIYWVARGEKDYPQLEYWMLQAGFDPICKFNRVQDVRSMTAAYLDKPQFYIKSDKPEWIRDLLKHSAIGDAITDAYDLIYARKEHLEGSDAVKKVVATLTTPEYPEPKSGHIVTDEQALAAVDEFVQIVKTKTHLDASPGETYQITASDVDDALAVLSKKVYMAIPLEIYRKVWGFTDVLGLPSTYCYPRSFHNLPTSVLLQAAYDEFWRTLMPDDKREVDWESISPTPERFEPGSREAAYDLSAERMSKLREFQDLLKLANGEITHAGRRQATLSAIYKFAQEAGLTEDDVKRAVGFMDIQPPHQWKIMESVFTMSLDDFAQRFTERPFHITRHNIGYTRDLLDALGKMPMRNVPEGDGRYVIVDDTIVDDLVRSYAAKLGYPITVGDVEKSLRYDCKNGHYVIFKPALSLNPETFLQNVAGRPSKETDR